MIYLQSRNSIYIYKYLGARALWKSYWTFKVRTLDFKAIIYLYEAVSIQRRIFLQRKDILIIYRNISIFAVG